MIRRNILAVAAAAIASGSITPGAQADPSPRPAFPAAVGFGSGAIGWRGGAIMTVDTLADAGPGSLRACAEAGSAPRICVFAVSGTIVVGSPIMVGSNVYLAGQTAPGQGIQLRLDAPGGSPLVIKNAAHVMVRFLKLRPGPSREPDPSVSGLLVMNSHDVMIDHCDIAFATDQNFSVHFERGSTWNVTLQRSIVAWGLDRSNHPSGRHSKGALVCSGVRETGECGRVTLRENLFAHNRDRNPEIHGTGLGPFDVVNNLFYDAKSQWGEFYDHYGSTEIDYYGNLSIAGPATPRSPEPPIAETYDYQAGRVARIRARDNLSVPRGSSKAVAARIAPAAPADLTAPAPPSRLGPVLPAWSVKARVLADAGARRPDGSMTDDLQRLLIASVENRTGGIIDSVEEVRGWPDLPTVRARADRDGDGMPDVWERARKFLDRDDPTDAWRDRDGDGTPNIEEYLEATASRNEPE